MQTSLPLASEYLGTEANGYVLHTGNVCQSIMGGIITELDHRTNLSASQ